MVWFKKKSRRCGDIFFWSGSLLGGICQDSPPRAYEDLDLSFPPGQGHYLNWQPRHFETETAVIDDEAYKSVDIDRNSKFLCFNFARSSKVFFSERHKTVSRGYYYYCCCYGATAESMRRVKTPSINDMYIQTWQRKW